MFMKSALFSISVALLLGTAFPAYAMDENAKEIKRLKIQYKLAKNNCQPVISEAVEKTVYRSKELSYKRVLHLVKTPQLYSTSYPYSTNRLYKPKDCPTCKSRKEMLETILSLLDKK